MSNAAETIPTYTVAQVAAKLGGEAIGDASTALTGFAPAANAKAGDLTFAENETYFARAEESAAAAILVDKAFQSDKKIIIRVPNARVAFAKVLPLFFPEPQFAPGIHPSAIIAASAQVDSSAHIGPHCVVGERVRIGARGVLRGGVHVAADSVLADDVHIFPNVTIYSRSQIGQRVRIHAGTVIGSDGFGYVFDQGVHCKVPQVGNVIIHDDVEIGSNVSIDRGALGPTIIGKGTKIDNLVQVAHNVIIGEHCLLVAHAGIAGSTRLGNYVTMAGQAGVAGHLKIGNRAIIAGGSGVIDDVPEGETWFGYPAQPVWQTKRQVVAARQLPELLRRVAELEKQLKDKVDDKER
jgi:UDP-3-O-[3-hydroxymyristoyl] glucosamine N-acyltransferase